jgi:hypothetical protein
MLLRKINLKYNYVNTVLGIFTNIITLSRICKNNSPYIQVNTVIFTVDRVLNSIEI